MMENVAISNITAQAFAAEQQGSMGCMID